MVRNSWGDLMSFIDISEVKDRLKSGDVIRLDHREGAFHVVNLAIDRSSVVLKREGVVLYEFETSEVLEHILTLNGVVVSKNTSDGEEITDTTRYRTQSGKQLYDVLADDLLTPEEFRGSIKKDVYKYVFRYKEKGGIASLEKAKATIDVLIAYEKELGEID